MTEPITREGRAMEAWNARDYVVSQPGEPSEELGRKVFDLVWRTDFSAPGFAVVDCGQDVDSHALRSWMVGLKALLSETNPRRGGPPFVYRSMGRFDQQETTKFHLDGAPPESLLMLGYEPSNVVSRLFLADYTRAAFDLKLPAQQFLKDYNPMFRRGEDVLRRYATELPQPEAGHSRILVINNSSLGFDEARRHPLGVMHMATIVTPNPAERRIVNSTMLATEGNEALPGVQAEFISTDAISQKFY